MKKILLSIIILLMVALIILTGVKGLKAFSIKGISDLKQESKKLDIKTQEATKLASTDYPKKLDDLNDSLKQLETEKTNYEDMVNISTEGEIQATIETYDHTIDFLRIRIENHASSENVKIKMDIVRSGTGIENTYNLNFTAIGPYIGVSDFISNIEEDSKLGFKIENFKMTTASEENSNSVQATFTCKDIKIEGISQLTSMDYQTQNNNVDEIKSNENTTTENNENKQ